MGPAVRLTFVLLEICIGLGVAIRLDHHQPFLYVTDPQDTRAPLGGSVQLSCRLFWKDAFGNNWKDYTPPVRVQWIINGFGYQIDLLEASYRNRLMVVGNHSCGIYDLRINKVELEDEGAFACQARIINSEPSVSANAIGTYWNQNYLTTGQSAMMIVRSKEAQLTVFAPPKRFGLFVGKFLTGLEAIARGGSQQTHHCQQEQKIFAQIGKPIFLTCASDESRPSALLEINFNSEAIALSSRNRTSCMAMEEGDWCVSDVASFRHAAFNLLVMEYRRNAHAIKGQSVRLIMEVLMKHEFAAPLSVKCEVKNGEEFTQSGPLKTPFETVASSTIHLHDIRNMSIHRVSVWNASHATEVIKFRCEGLVSRLDGQNVTLRWTLNKQKVAELSRLKMHKFGSMERFSADFEMQHPKSPREFTLQCSVKSQVLVSPSSLYVISRHRKIKVTIHKDSSLQVNRHFIITLEKARNSSNLLQIKEYFEVQDEVLPTNPHEPLNTRYTIEESDLGLEFSCRRVNASTTLSTWQVGVFEEDGRTIWCEMGIWKKFTLPWTALLRITPISSERRAFLYARSRNEVQNLNVSGFHSSQPNEILLLRCCAKDLLETGTFFIFSQESNFAMARAKGSEFVDTRLKSLTLLIVPLTIFGLVVLAVLLKRRNKDPLESMEFSPIQPQTTTGSRSLNNSRSEEGDDTKATTQKTDSTLRLLPKLEIRPEFGPTPSGLVQLELTYLPIVTRRRLPV
ncbi:hypothetical protein TcWFU_005309 [Taenia crassiceps]|uniref:Ig-like domain-containing protein n=1 Tax=Taenia crassiceps TaxID=6207 RepID=A0ABR4QLF1_9CEST